MWLTEWIYPFRCCVCKAFLTDVSPAQNLDARHLLCSKCELAQSDCKRSHTTNDHTINDHTINDQIVANSVKKSPIGDFLPCHYCGEWEWIHTTNNPHMKCLSCLISPLPMKSLHSLYYYSEPIKALLHALKYEGHWTLSKYVATLLASSIEESTTRPNETWDIIMAMPSASSQLRTRGFSHTSLITQSLGRRLHIPHCISALQTHNKAQAQVHLNLAERFSNIKNTFTVRSNRRIKNARILLIDDVVTSGASSIEATNTLLANGAQSVDVYTFARSYTFRYSRLTAHATTWAIDNHKEAA